MHGQFGRIGAKVRASRLLSITFFSHLREDARASTQIVVLPSKCYCVRSGGTATDALMSLYLPR